jgi:hypothetical protein
MKLLLLPTILSRVDIPDSGDKCSRFMWELPQEECDHLVNYRDM